MDHIRQYVLENAARQDRFFSGSAPGELLIFADYDMGESAGESRDIILPPEPDGHNGDYYFNNIERIARQWVERAENQARRRAALAPDDYCPSLCFHPGAGYQAAVSHGGNVRFYPEDRRSYTLEPACRDLDHAESVFRRENRWLDLLVCFWSAVDHFDPFAAVCTPRFYRSPLDLAWDLRDTQVFYDMIDDPEGLKELIRLCAENIIYTDNVARESCRYLREGYGGELGVALSAPAMILNGDPLDLLDDKKVIAFHNPGMEAICAYCSSVILHHHSIGIARSPVVAQAKGLRVQQVTLDPNGPPIVENLSQAMVASSLKTPILLRFRYMRSANFSILWQKN